MTPAPRNDSTLGYTLFFDPLAGQSSIGDLRFRIELKAAACAALEKFNGFPVDVRRIQNSKLRALVAAGLLFDDWSIHDLIACTDGLEGPADSVLIATLEDPAWGPEDFRLLEAIERLENLQSRALGGTRKL